MRILSPGFCAILFLLVFRPCGQGLGQEARKASQRGEGKAREEEAREGSRLDSKAPREEGLDQAPAEISQKCERCCPEGSPPWCLSLCRHGLTGQRLLEKRLSARGQRTAVGKRESPPGSDPFGVRLAVRAGELRKAASRDETGCPELPGPGPHGARGPSAGLPLEKKQDEGKEGKRKERR